MVWRNARYEQALVCLIKLDGCVRELRAAPALTLRVAKPLHILVKPESQCPWGFECSVVALPFRFSVAAVETKLLTHLPSLPAGKL